MVRESVGTFMLAVAFASSALGLTAGDKCEADKLKTAGKYAFCRMNAESKAIKKGAPPDYSKCDEKFGAKWTLVESKAGGSCPVSDDQGDIQAQATGATDDLAAAIGGTPPANCGSDLALCQGDLSSCSGNLSSCSASLAACGGDLTTCQADLTQVGGELSACESDLGQVEADLTTCESDLVAAGLCGNGVVDAGEDCDQSALDGDTCVSQSFGGGVLACGNGCAFDTSGCWATRFVDNGDGTITDNATGLLWEKEIEADGASNFANPHDADNTVRWAGTCSVNTSKLCQPTAVAASLCALYTEGNQTGCEECIGGDGTCGSAVTAWTVAVDRNAVTFAGHNDWRPPTRDELATLVDIEDATSPNAFPALHGTNCGGSCTSLADPACSCTNVNSRRYWTATTSAPTVTSGWEVNFLLGSIATDGKSTTTKGVRLVRGGN